METKHLIEIDTDYDVEFLVFSAKKNLNKSLIMLGLYSVILAVSVLSVIFWGSCVPIFVIGIVATCVCAFLILKRLKAIRISDFKTSQGEIVDIHKEIKIIDTMSVGGINPFGTRKFDNYKKNEIRLGIFFHDGDTVCGYFFNDGTEEHAKYYETKGKAIHIWGTHFPVKLEIGKEQWLCPICGEFNVNEEKTCARCKRKILK